MGRASRSTAGIPGDLLAIQPTKRGRGRRRSAGDRRVPRQRLHGDRARRSAAASGHESHAIPIPRAARVAAIGRFFIDADAEDGAAPVVVLGHSVWRDSFGGDPAVLNRSLTLDDVDHRIVGVAPAGFAFPEKQVGLRDDRRAVTIYTPYAARAQRGAKVIDILNAIARLRPGRPSLRRSRGTATLEAVERPLADLVFGKGKPSKSACDRWRSDDAASAAGAAGVDGRSRPAVGDRMRERGEPVSLARQRPTAKSWLCALHLVPGEGG